jgi:hypothetical protein
MDHQAPIDMGNGDILLLSVKFRDSFAISTYVKELFLQTFIMFFDRLSGLVVRVPGWRLGGLGSIPGATTFSEK